MKAHVQWLSYKIGLVRVGENFREFGDSYEIVCTVLRSGDSCHIIGMAGKAGTFNREAFRAIRDALAEEGVFSATWERLKAGVSLPRFHK